MPLDTIRFGIIGVGRHGSRYARHITRDMEDAILSAFSRSNRDDGLRFAEETGSSFHHDWRDLVDSPEVDAVVLAATTNLHEPVTLRAVEAGKPILLEKPLARNSAEGKRICDAAEQFDTPVMVAQTLRYNTVVNEIRRLLPTIGKLHFISMAQRMEPHGLPWLDNADLAGGGNILHTGIHLTDMVNFLLDDSAAWAWCFAEKKYHRITEDQFTATIGMNSGVSVTIDCSKVSESRIGRIEVIGEHGQLVGDHVHNTLFLHNADCKTPLPLPEPRHTILDVLRDFTDSLREKTPPPITCRDGLLALETVDMCYESTRHGSAVITRG